MSLFFNENKNETLDCLKISWPEKEMKNIHLNFTFLIQSSKYTVAISSHTMAKIKKKKKNNF